RCCERRPVTRRGWEEGFLPRPSRRSRNPKNVMIVGRNPPEEVSLICNKRAECRFWEFWGGSDVVRRERSPSNSTPGCKWCTLRRLTWGKENLPGDVAAYPQK